MSMFFWRIVLVILVIAMAVLIAPDQVRALAPKHHLDVILEALEGAGFSEGQAWLLAYFSIEIDMATEVPREFCWWPIRWHTRSYVCPANVGLIQPTVSSPCSYNPDVPSGNFYFWADQCLPFHNCSLPYPLGLGKPAKGLDGFMKMRNLPSLHEAMHVKPGERCYDALRRFGYALHGIQDFYAHSNWIEVFHADLGFDFNDIPTWTSFQKAQRGGKLNLILLQHTSGDVKKAEDLYDKLDGNLQLGNGGWHDKYKKDSDDKSRYNSENSRIHQDGEGHDVLDFFQAAKYTAGTETYQLGLEFRSNIVNNPQLGGAVWKNMFDCVTEMAAYDRVSYETELGDYKKSIGRLKTYGRSFWR